MVLCSPKIDVGKYNDIMITKLFSHFIVYSIHIHSNTSRVDSLDTWVNNPHFNLVKKVAININISLAKT
jgi:hypothetical protein